jgi:hypothetical protein
MLKFIHNYFFGRAVCKKYGLKFKPLFVLKNYGYLMPGNKIVGVSIFTNDFKYTLLHEIGHWIDMFKSPDVFKRSTYKYEFTPLPFLQMLGHKTKIPVYKGLWLSERNMEFTAVLMSEAKASRFANKVLKGKGKDILIKAFRSYVSAGLEQLIKIDSNDIGNYMEYCVKLEKLITNY